jgi:hypothetical protein
MPEIQSARLRIERWILFDRAKTAIVDPISPNPVGFLMPFEV